MYMRYVCNTQEPSCEQGWMVPYGQAANHTIRANHNQGWTNLPEAIPTRTL